MNEKLTHICQSSLKLFLEQGIRNVNMDELCRYMHISKKTLYQYVDNKEDLLSKILDVLKKSHGSPQMKIAMEEKNAIEVLFFISQRIYEFHINVKNIFSSDLKKYYPHLWESFDESMRAKTYTYLKNNIEQGISEKLYRDDIDVDMTVSLYMAKIDGVHSNFSKNTEKYTFRQLFEVLFEHQIRAIATQQGLQFLEKEIEEFRLTFENN